MADRLPIMGRIAGACALLTAGAFLAGCAPTDPLPPPTPARPSASTPPAIGEPASALDRNIWVCFQASNGDRWFGSDGMGAYRHDGRGLVRLSSKDGLASDRVREIQEDASGAILIGTLEGVSRFDGRTLTTLVPVEHEGVDGWRLDDRDLWFKGDSMSDGPLRYDGTTLHRLHLPRTERGDEYLRVYGAQPWSAYGVYTIYRDRRGSLWFGTAALGLCRYDGRGFGWMYENDLTNPPGGGSFGIRSIMEDRDGRFWICNTAQRFAIDGGAGAVMYRAEPGVPVAGAAPGAGAAPIYFNGIARDARGVLWMCTYGDGVWRFDGTTLKHVRVRPASAGAKDARTVKDVLGVSISTDRRGEVWLATQDAGAFWFDGTAFRPFRPDAAGR